MYIRIQMMAASATCLSLNLFSALLILLISTINLAQNRYFEDEAFIGYLKYLQYWQRPEYIKFIMYPHCLFFLELLQNPNFRSAMAHPANKELAHRQQFYLWKNYRNNRLKHILPKPLPELSNVPSASVGPPMLPSDQYSCSCSIYSCCSSSFANVVWHGLWI
ncbi:hypothetical protein OROMI_007274 [Orobanche minor]